MEFLTTQVASYPTLKDSMSDLGTYVCLEIKSSKYLHLSRPYFLLKVTRRFRHFLKNFFLQILFAR